MRCVINWVRYQKQAGKKSLIYLAREWMISNNKYTK